MKLHYWIIALGIFMLAMGIVGYFRTGSPTSIFIAGGIGVVTAILGYFVGGGSPLLWKVTLGWIGINTVMLGYMTFKRIAAHATARAGTEYIFGSMALFALIVLIMMIVRSVRGSTT